MPCHLPAASSKPVQVMMCTFCKVGQNAQPSHHGWCYVRLMAKHHQLYCCRMANHCVESVSDGGHQVMAGLGRISTFMYVHSCDQ